MSSTILVVFGGAAPEAPLSWIRVRRNDLAEVARGVLGANGGSLKERDAYAVLVIPALEAQLRAVDLPAKTDAQARGAASFVFEGELAMDPAQVFHAVGTAFNTAGRRLVAAIDRRRLQAWIQRCRNSGISPRSIFLDSTLVAVAAGRARVFENGGYVMVAGGQSGGFSIETALAPLLVKAWFSRMRDEVRDVYLEGDGLDDVAAALSGGDAHLNRVAGPDLMLTLAGAAINPPAYAPDLQQGDVAPSAGNKGQGRAWAAACVLVVAVVAVQVALLVSDGWRDRQSAKVVLAAAEQEFRKVRPDVKRIVNLRAQVTAALNAAQKPARNPVIAASYPVVDLLLAHPDVQLDEMRHTAPGRRVSMRFSGAQPASLEAAIVELKKADSDVEIGQTQTEQGRVSVAVTMVVP